MLMNFAGVIFHCLYKANSVGEPGTIKEMQALSSRNNVDPMVTKAYDADKDFTTPTWTPTSLQLS